MKKGLYERREKVLNSLKEQLKSNKKREKVNGKTTDNMVELSDNDKKRIKEEITILEKRM